MHACRHASVPKYTVHLQSSQHLAVIGRATDSWHTHECIALRLHEPKPEPLHPRSRPHAKALHPCYVPDVTLRSESHLGLDISQHSLLVSSLSEALDNGVQCLNACEALVSLQLLLWVRNNDTMNNESMTLTMIGTCNGFRGKRQRGLWHAWADA